MLRIATPDDIKSGKVTDVYFARTAEILRAKGVDKRVRAEFIVKDSPKGGTGRSWPASKKLSMS